MKRHIGMVGDGMTRLGIGKAGVVAVALLLAVVAGLGGCAEDRELPARRPVTALPEPDADSTDILGEALMIALAQAKNFHHKADVYLQEGKSAEAAEALHQLLGVPFPDGAPEGEDVLLDARARLAKLLLTRGAIQDALQLVDEGIDGARRRSFFLANLYTVKGEIHEAAAQALDQQGDEAGAGTARRDAIEAFDESISINRALQQALVNEGNR